MSDQFDVQVHDADALDEIELLANLIVATTEHDGPLPQRRIDEILGVGSDSTPAVDAAPEPVDNEPDGDRATFAETSGPDH